MPSQRQARGAQRRPRVVGRLTHPHQVPQRPHQRKRGHLELGQQVAEEARPRAQALAQQRVLGLRRRLAMPSGRRGGRAQQLGVLAEVERHAPRVAPERAGADPHDLAACAQRVQPRGRVGARPGCQHVALPCRHGKRQALQRNEHLAQALHASTDRGSIPHSPGASTAGSPIGQRLRARAPAADALPRGHERGQSTLPDRLDLLTQGSKRGTAHAP